MYMAYDVYIVCCYTVNNANKQSSLYHNLLTTVFFNACKIKYMYKVLCTKHSDRVKVLLL